MRADAREGDGLCLRPSQQPSDPPPMGTAFTPAKTSPASWDAFADVEAFVDAVLAELAAMAADGTRPTRSGPKPPLTGAALRKAILAIWCVAFCGMQWRAIGQLCDPLRKLLADWEFLLGRFIVTFREDGLRSMQRPPWRRSRGGALMTFAELMAAANDSGSKTERNPG